MPDDLVKIKKDSGSEVCCASDGEHYPYGTRLSFESDLIDELGLDALSVGDVVMVKAIAFVESKSVHESGSMKHKDVGIQLTAIKINRDDVDMVDKLYGERS